MRKIVFALLLSLPLPAAFSQPTYSNIDTVTNMPGYYYVPWWYSQCVSFRADTISFYERGLARNNYDGFSPNNVTVREFHTNAPRAVYGMVALVEINPWAHITTPLQDPSAGRAPEFLKLLQGTDPILYYPGGDSSQAPQEDAFPHHMTMLDSLRWDTVTPRILRLPMKYNAVDDTDFFYCYAYECWFTTPVVVDSTFYVLGTYQSNLCSAEGYANYPTSYFLIREKSDIFCGQCTEVAAYKVFSVSNFPNQNYLQWHRDDLGGAFFGLFYPLVDTPSAKQKTGTRRPR